MNKRIVILLSMLFAAGSGFARTSVGEGVFITGLEVNRNGEVAQIKFNAEIGRRAVKSDYSLTFAPELTGGAQKLGLPALVIQGKRSKNSFRRNNRQEPQTDGVPQAVYVLNGETVKYSILFYYEPWMENSRLIFQGYLEGCCGAERTKPMLLADNLLVPEMIEVPKEPVLTTGEVLAEVYPFISRAPESRLFSEQIWEDGGATVYFRQGQPMIDRGYMDNNETLIDLVSAIRQLSAADDSRIAKILVIGFSSPEGSDKTNAYLADHRAMAFKDFILHNSDMDESTIEVLNGAANWTGLRKLIANSDIKERREMLSIIDNTPVPEDRLNRLKGIGRGGPYRYVSRNYFPLLRSATYIHIYFENKKQPNDSNRQLNTNK